LPGNVAVLTGALEGVAGFALSNPVGGIALQMVWLAIADLIYRRANLEHAAASLENLMQTVILMALLAVPVMAYATPALRLGWIHPVTFLIPGLYGYGLYLLRRIHAAPMWQPTRTVETADDDGDGDEEAEVPQSVRQQSTSRLWTTLGVVVLITAVRLGQLTLGVGNIIGGNAYDVLMVALADVGCLEGPLYRDAGPTSLVLLGGTALMTAVLAGGLVMRERRWVGFEGISIPVIYVATILLAMASA
jgi:cation:H+ antiporter